ncbi:MAG: sulfite oxidase [Planctomyces sp.]|nr:sulfite oxidase [Planctomyces sp.]
MRAAAGASRRTFLGGLAAAVPMLAAAGTGRGADNESDALDIPGLITRQKGPDNLEFPFSNLKSFITPTEQFFVRSHFEVPTVTADDWTLTVEGHVERPLTLRYDELRSQPATKRTALLECAGNGRVFLKGLQPGLRWELGGVSNAEWTGIPLATLLQRAGVKPGAVDVVLEGADTGEVRPPNPATPGVISYSRSLPLAKANSPEVLLAWQMNGEDLTVPHGFPVRAVVAGWYGMASVKWLKRIVVLDRPYDGYYQTFNYTIWQRPQGLPTLTPVTELDVKSQIARPAGFEVVPRNSEYRVHGAAWAGDAEITNVEFSTDDGRTWTNAALVGEHVPYAWRFWEHAWRTPEQPGSTVLMSRATDSRGRTQAMERDADRRDAMISHVLPVAVEIR